VNYVDFRQMPAGCKNGKSRKNTHLRGIWSEMEITGKIRGSGEGGRIKGEKKVGKGGK